MPILRSRKILSLVIVSAACGRSSPPAAQSPTAQSIERVTNAAAAPEPSAPVITADEMLVELLDYDTPLTTPEGRPACGNVVGKGQRGDCL
jgi:hypothetical protein